MGAQTSGIAIRLYFHISVHSSIRTFTRMAALLSVKWQPSVTSAELFSFSISSSLLFSFPHSLTNLFATRWRFMQSRGRQAEGRMIEGFGSNRFKLLLFLVGNDIVAFV